MVLLVKAANLQQENEPSCCVTPQTWHDTLPAAVSTDQSLLTRVCLWHARCCCSLPLRQAYINTSGSMIASSDCAKMQQAPINAVLGLCGISDPYKFHPPKYFLTRLG